MTSRNSNTGLAIYEFQDGSQPFIACLRHNQGAPKVADLPMGHEESCAECDLAEPEPFQFAIDPVLPDPVGPHTHKLSGCEVCREWEAERSKLAESHRRQFNGEDYQAVAQELCDRMKNPRQEDYLELSTSPDPGCGCEFCRTADWEVWN